jgi:sulfate/thiosulfate transport system permease protein
MAVKKFNPLPGFGLTMGYTLFYLSAIVIIPIAGLFLKSFNLSWAEFWRLVTGARALTAYRLTFGASLIAALINAFFGTLLAWVLARYQFFGRRFIDALVDFPFALPTAVAGLALSSLFTLFDKNIINLFGRQSAIGNFLASHDFKVANSPMAVVVALTFVGLPFVVRTLQPVLENLEGEIEEAAATLGASRLRTFITILAPTLLPTVITGFALAFARAVGEYGSIVFVSSNIPYRTEIAPHLIVIHLEEFHYLEATAIAAVLLLISFTILAIINWLEVWAGRFNK